jgi:hypothetical protein
VSSSPSESSVTSEEDAESESESEPVGRGYFCCREGPAILDQLILMVGIRFSYLLRCKTCMDCKDCNTVSRVMGTSKQASEWTSKNPGLL